MFGICLAILMISAGALLGALWLYVRALAIQNRAQEALREIQATEAPKCWAQQSRDVKGRFRKKGEQ